MKLNFKFLSLTFLVSILLLVNSGYSTTITIYPSFDVINKSSSIYVGAEDNLIHLVGLKSSEGILSNDYRQYKQIEVGEYLTLIKLDFNGQILLKNIHHYQFNLKLKDEIEISIFNSKEEQIKSKVNLKLGTETKIDLDGDLVDDLILVYLGLDSSNLIEIKAKGIYDDTILINNNDYCKLTDSGIIYDCYGSELNNGEITKTYQLNKNGEVKNYIDKSENPLETNSSKVIENSTDLFIGEGKTQEKSSKLWWYVLLTLIIMGGISYYYLKFIKKKEEVFI